MATPTVPSIATGNQQFSIDMRAFHEWEAGELWTAVDSFFNTRLLGTTDTSSSSVLIGTGDKTFTVTAGKAFAAGMSVNVVNTANPANYMSGFVKSYSSTTLVVTVITTGGAGTLAAWSIALGLSGGGATLGANVFTALQRWTTGSNIASSATVDLTAATGNTVNITGTVATSAFTITAGQWMLLIPTGAWPLTYNATTCNINGGASYTCAAGDRVLVTKALDGVTYVNVIKQDGSAISGSVLKNYFTGGELSTAGASATMSIAAGQFADSTNAALMTLSAIAKTTSAWAVGTAAGGLDTGTIANSTWYHFYAIRRPDTGVVDVVFSTSATSPTLPTNYTQYRYLGSGKTNGSAQWTSFSQVGNDVLWDAAVVSFDAVNPGTAAVTRTVDTPTGVKTLAKLSCGVGGFTTGSLQAVFSSLDVSDQAPQIGGTAALTGFNSIGAATGTVAWMFSEQEVRTNTSAQIRTRLSASSTNDRIGAITRGWKYIR